MAATEVPRRRSPACSASSIMCSTGGWWRGAQTAPRARPGFSDPDGLDDPSAEAEEAEETEEVEEEVSLEVTLPGAILQAERYRRPPPLVSAPVFLMKYVNQHFCCLYFSEGVPVPVNQLGLPLSNFQYR